MGEEEKINVVEMLTFEVRNALDRQGCELTSYTLRPAIRAALTALQADGWVVVRKEPTDRMRDAGYLAWKEATIREDDWVAQCVRETGGLPSYRSNALRDAYVAMIEAASPGDAAPKTHGISHRREPFKRE